MASWFHGNHKICKWGEYSRRKRVWYRWCLLRHSLFWSPSTLLGSWGCRNAHRFVSLSFPSHIFLTAFTGISQYTNPSHIARATLEANAFQTRAIIESMKLDSGSDLKQLKVDGGMTNGDLAMSILADIGGFSVIRPEMRECVPVFCRACF